MPRRKGLPDIPIGGRKDGKDQSEECVYEMPDAQYKDGQGTTKPQGTRTSRIIRHADQARTAHRLSTRGINDDSIAIRNLVRDRADIRDGGDRDTEGLERDVGPDIRC